MSGTLIRRLVVAALGFAFVLSLPGCGYTSKPTFRDDVRTVALPIFKNRTFYREVEFDLTEALAKEIELRTPYKVVPESRADTVLSGTIVAIQQDRLSVRREGGLPQEMETRIIIDFEWLDRNGEVLRSRQGLTVIGRYVPARPVGEPFEVSQHEAVQRMAQQVVGVMRDDW